MRGAGASVGMCAVLLLAIADGGRAQSPEGWVRSTTEGFHLAAHLDGSAIAYQGEDEIEAGPGAGLAIGYGVSRLLTLYLDVAAADVEVARGGGSYTLAHVDLGTRFALGGPQRNVRGYVAAGFNGRAASARVDGSLLTVQGGGLSFGGGLLVFLSTSAALDFGVRWSAGAFSDADYAGRSEAIDLSAVSTRLNVGVSWWAG